jgi:hypothetical protein
VIEMMNFMCKLGRKWIAMSGKKGKTMKETLHDEHPKTNNVTTRFFMAKNHWIFFCNPLDSRCFSQYHSVNL